MVDSVPRRILLKLSGESLGGKSGSGLAPEALSFVVKQVARAAQSVQIALVVGAGNICRGSSFSGMEIHRTEADAIGMVSTHVNALALAAFLRAQGANCIVMGPHSSVSQVERFDAARARAALSGNQIVILAGGTGNPFFTTDTCAALRASELDAHELLKGTKHDGIFDSDPAQNPTAKKFEQITFDEVIQRGLAAMDQTAFTMCRENKIPLRIFDMNRPDAIFEALTGNAVGSLISSQEG